MGGSRAEESFRPAGAGDRDAVRGRRGRHPARIAPVRRIVDYLHRLAGTFANDPQYVQNCRGTAARCFPRERAGACRQCPQHLWRPPGCHGHATDWVFPPSLRQCPGVHGFGGGRAFVGHRGPNPFPAFLRRLPDFPRDPEDRSAGIRGAGGTAGPGGGRGVPRAGAESGPSRGARDDAKSGYLFPDPRSGEQVLRAAAPRRRKNHGRDQQTYRARLSAVQLLWRRRRGAGHRCHGIGL